MTPPSFDDAFQSLFLPPKLHSRSQTMRCSKVAFISLLILLCCFTNLGSAVDCTLEKSTGTVRCRFAHTPGGRVAVVISSDVDHSGEALDFINSWDRFPPCSTPSNVAQETHVDRELLPALVLRLSCDWGYKNCQHAAQQLTDAAQPHMHCFSQLILRMNIVMFRAIKTGGSIVADCFEYVALVLVSLDSCLIVYRHECIL